MLLLQMVCCFSKRITSLASCLFCRLSLGIPASLLMSGLDLATKCIREVAPEAGVGARVVIEAGYILLGALCVALPQDVMDVGFCYIVLIAAVKQ